MSTLERQSPILPVVGRAAARVTERRWDSNPQPRTTRIHNPAQSTARGSRCERPNRSATRPPGSISLFPRPATTVREMMESVMSYTRTLVYFEPYNLSSMGHMDGYVFLTRLTVL